MRISRISIAPVKGMALVHPGEALLGRTGILNDRRFYLVDPDGRLVNNKNCGELLQIRPAVSDDASRLALHFPGGTVDGEVEPGERVETSFYGRPVEGRYVQGPWSDAISEHAGTPLRLVRTDTPGETGRWPPSAATPVWTQSTAAASA
jgi:uncharacterized protein YcbX